MKTLFVLLAVATVVCMVSVEAGPMHKRLFLIDPVLFPNDEYSKAKAIFEKIINSIDFDAAVDLLIPYISSGMTVSACVTVCTGAASAVLGPFGITHAIACEPLCEGALIKLEQLASSG